MKRTEIPITLRDMFNTISNTLAIRVHASNFRDAMNMLHELGWRFSSGRPLISTHVDAKYVIAEENNCRPYIILWAEDYSVTWGKSSAYQELVRYTFDDLLQAYNRFRPQEVQPINLSSLYDMVEV